MGAILPLYSNRCPFMFCLPPLLNRPLSQKSSVVTRPWTCSDTRRNSAPTWVFLSSKRLQWLPEHHEGSGRLERWPFVTRSNARIVNLRYRHALSYVTRRWRATSVTHIGCVRASFPRSVTWASEASPYPISHICRSSTDELLCSHCWPWASTQVSPVLSKPCIEQSNNSLARKWRLTGCLCSSRVSASFQFPLTFVSFFHRHNSPSLFIPVLVLRFLSHPFYVTDIMYVTFSVCCLPSDRLDRIRDNAGAYNMFGLLLEHQKLFTQAEMAYARSVCTAGKIKWYLCCNSLNSWARLVEILEFPPMNWLDHWLINLLYRLSIWLGDCPIGSLTNRLTGRLTDDHRHFDWFIDCFLLTD